LLLGAAVIGAAKGSVRVRAQRFIGAVLLAGVASGSAFAVDGVSIQGGVGAASSEGSGTEMIRAAAQWDWNRRWLQGKEWHVGGFWNVGAGYWQRDATPGQNGELYEIGVTPVFRLQGNELAGPYVEAGVGAHLLSETSLGDRRFSTSFQFGSHLGVGYRFGARQAFDLSYSYQHLSNADIKKPNDGIDFHQVRLQYHF
jgi:opacity protein-like surface antigen